MRALDLFSGAAGGWTLGLHRAGIETVAACEADPWRRAVYGARWPGVKLYDDVRTLTGERVLADVGAVQLVCGSPPCQDASTANAKGRGIDGERTGLFRDAVRLVSELRPDWVCFENVPGIRARGADWIIGAMEAEGYTVWALVVGAVHAGAPHRRQRVWFVAHANGRNEYRKPVNGEVAGIVGSNAPDTDSAALRHQSGRSSGPDGSGAAEPGDDARHPHGEGLEIRQSIGSDARSELPLAIRAIGEAWPGWNGGLAGIGRVDDGLFAELASLRVASAGRRSDRRHGRPSRKLQTTGVGRNILAAYGDAVCPQIPEAIGRSILAINAMSMRNAA